MIRPKALPGAYDLIHSGAIALAEAETKGIHIDMDQLRDNKAELARRCADIELKLKTDLWGDVWGRQRAMFGAGAKVTAAQQIAAVYFSPKDKGGLGHKPTKFTDKGAVAYGAEAFADIVDDEPWLQAHHLMTSLQMVSTRYLDAVANETVLHRDIVTGEHLHLVHPSNSLNSADTYRSSVSNPPFQQMPIRDEKMAFWIRSCVVPRPRRSLIECDFSGAEVRGGAAYHKDKNMIRYLNVGGDMHWDGCEMLFLCTRDEMGSNFRRDMKGFFTFAEFYGDYWGSIGTNIWNWMRRELPKLKDGTLIFDHLAKKGIKSLGDVDNPVKGTWLFHVKSVEQRFWNEMFPDYNKWRIKLWESFQANPELTTLSGFYHRRPFRRNVLLNNPIQGFSFHCLLWVFTHLAAELEREKCPADLVMQIHDSMIGDVEEGFEEEFVQRADRIVKEELPLRFPAIAEVGMIAEAKKSESYERGGSWNEMEKYSVGV